MSNHAPRSLRVRTGDGRLCRTDDGLLFTPAVAEGWDELVAAARTPASVGAGTEAVTRVLVGRGLDAPALVHVTWRPRLVVVAYGDVEVRTDHPALPMLTGRGSETWVEHTLPGLEERLVVTVEPPEDGEADTDLLDGVVPAGGFRLELAAGRSAPGPSPELRPPHVTFGDPAGQEPTPTASDGPPPSADPTTAPAMGTTDPIPPSVPDDVSVGTADPDATLGAIRAAAVTGDGSGPQSARGASDPGAGPAPRPVPTEPPAPPDDVVPGSSRPDAPDEDAAESAPLIDAVLCERGHPNPPGRGSCRRCGELLRPDAPTSTVPRPSLGRLVFDDGEEIELDTDLALGRRPREDGPRGVVLSGDRVSRHHAELHLRGWEVLLYDPGSRNGTYVVGPDSADPVRVDSEVPVLLEPDCRVYLGTRSFVFDDRSGDVDQSEAMFPPEG